MKLDLMNLKENFSTTKQTNQLLKKLKMSNFKGTTGNWEIKKPEHIGCTLVSFGDFKGGLEIWHHQGDTHTKDEAIANALLISKSKKLLEHLEYLIENYYIDEPFVEKETIALIDEATNIENLKIR